ncbi:hypothetical protein BSL78_23978 [Apostichopus japonicus]|uniref:Ubiquitin carboxyl-terminal hydrolase n=1 Tax=Stichopus japonicus TaxID=307972 RepID=A0A2G8JU00_STIJA|nr:hypothetical protein BSL78_23978 [Apostichopus japonicus]
MEGLPQTSDSTGIVDPESLKEIQQRDGEVNETQTELDRNEEKGEAECNKDNVNTKEDNTRGGEDAQTTEKASTDQTTVNSGSTDKAEDGRNQNAVDNGNSLLAQAPLVHPETSSATASPRHDQPVQEYHLKWVDWNNRKTPIVTQNENGPCPLIAILNVLLLRAVIEIPEGVEIVTATQLINYLGNTILQRIPEDATEAVRKNFEKNMSDAMEIVSKLQTGLDVNVRFTGVGDFEYTQECLIFDLVNISLYHGWLYDPQNTELISAVGTCSYNQLVEKIIESKNSEEGLEQHQGLVAENFLQTSAAQLTYHGLCELNSTIENNQLCVLFRNNHFSTLCKHDDVLYILVTDQGFLTASNVVWESLSNVEGDSLFYDGAFQRCLPNIKPVLDAASPMSMEQQIDSDFLVALSMQEDQPSSKSQAPPQAEQPSDDTNLTDQELAMKLQEEEDLQAARMVQEQEQAAAAAGAGADQQAGAGGGGGGQQRQVDDRQANGAGGGGAGGQPPQQRQGRREPRDKSCTIL